MTELVIVIGMTQAQLVDEAVRLGITVEELVAHLPQDRVQRFVVPDKKATP